MKLERGIALCVLCLPIVLSSGCTYRGELRPDFYNTARAPVIENIFPVRAALVSEFEENVFQYRGSHSVEIQLTPGLIPASQKALQRVFSTVEIVDDPSGGKEHDILILLKFASQETYRNTMTGQVDFRVRLTMSFEEPGTRQVVSSLQTSTGVAYTPSMETLTASILTGLSLYTLSPITIPWTTNAVGRDAEALLEETFEKMLKNLTSRIANHAEVAKFVTDKHSGKPYFGKSVPANQGMGPISSGSAFVVSKEGHIVTNHHVIDGCSRLEGTVQGRHEKLAIVQKDARNDLALLKGEITSSATATFREGARVRAGDSVVALGFPLHGLLSPEANVTTGTVSSLSGIAGDSRMIQITAPIQPGNSGGPLLDLNGNVVGMVVAQLDAIKVGKVTGSLPQTVNFAVTSSIVQNFLESAGINHVSSKSSVASRLEPADVAEKGRAFTVLVECYE
jgi:S1-C subfamily serine protease